MYFRTQAAINLDSLEYNINSVKEKLTNHVKLLAVIKADAYGHGAVEFAKFLENKCDFFGVACIEEAIELKKAHIKTPVLILGHVSTYNYFDVVKYDIRIPIFSFDDAKELSKEALRQHKTIPYHFCIDTGMNRIGFKPTQKNADLCKEIYTLPNIICEGIFSHFATADEKDLSKSFEQCNRFESFIKMLEDRNITIPIKHINNSAGIMNFSKHFDMCRMGIITYGLYPSEDVDKKLLDIKPVMSWITHISFIKTLSPGEEISYGGTYKTTKQQKIATIPVGYADGYPRCLSNIGKVIINGEFAPIVGRICMDQFMVDVTDIDDVNIETKVTLIGKQGDCTITMEEFANAAHSFNYEQICRIARRVPRVYYSNGKIVKTTNYMY